MYRKLLLILPLLLFLTTGCQTEQSIKRTSQDKQSIPSHTQSASDYEAENGETGYRSQRSRRSRTVQGEFSGKVVSIKDGDTIEVMNGGRAERIRLAEIDCPESSQAFGDRAKQFTGDIVFGKVVTVKVRDIDRYGRTVGEVILPDGKSLNRELVSAGLAWWYRQYSEDESIGKLESEARAARKGLWVDANPTAPWDYRHRR